jgi:hypothetical protein
MTVDPMDSDNTMKTKSSVISHRHAVGGEYSMHGLTVSRPTSPGCKTRRPRSDMATGGSEVFQYKDIRKNHI